MKTVYFIYINLSTVSYKVMNPEAKWIVLDYASLKIFC